MDFQKCGHCRREILNAGALANHEKKCGQEWKKRKLQEKLEEDQVIYYPELAREMEEDKEKEKEKENEKEKEREKEKENCIQDQDQDQDQETSESEMEDFADEHRNLVKLFSELTESEESEEFDEDDDDEDDKEVQNMNGGVPLQPLGIQSDDSETIFDFNGIKVDNRMNFIWISLYLLKFHFISFSSMS